VIEMVEDQPKAKRLIKKCRLVKETDIVILIDGSWSVGIATFKKLQIFLINLVKAFSIEPTGVHIGVAQYSVNTRTEFYLNEYTERGEIKEALGNISYKGGNTATGNAINYIREVMFSRNNGARPNATRKAIIITDGQSTLDEIGDSVNRLIDTDVELFILGLPGSLRSDLNEIASSPLEKHIFMIEDIDDLISVKKRFLKKFCKRSSNKNEDNSEDDQ